MPPHPRVTIKALEELADAKQYEECVLSTADSERWMGSFPLRFQPLNPLCRSLFSAAVW